MSAALIPDPAEWRSSGHGLSVSGEAVGELGDLKIKPDKRDDSSFALFCKSIGSARLTGPVVLSQLWGAASRFRMVDGLGGDAPVAERFTSVGGNDGRFYLEGRIAEGLPGSLDQRSAEITKRLKPYVGNVEGVESKVTLWPKQSFKCARVEFTWSNADGTRRDFDEIATPVRPSGDSGYVLIPMIGQGQDRIHPLAATYACLLALSSAARYYPELWMRSLDRDRSPVAVAVEEALDLLGESLPHDVRGFLEAAPTKPR